MPIFKPGRKDTRHKKNAVNQAYPSDPDLLMLRDAAIDERNAIALYLEAARESNRQKLFLSTAEDEMHHYAELMQAICRLDPVQAAYLKAEDLTLLTMVRAPKTKIKVNNPPAASESGLPSVPDEQDMRAVRYLTRGLGDELGAVNKYQRYMNQAQHDFVCDLFGHIMNEEKEHVAQFTAALFDITEEPLPPE